jgi:hypothetical protein
MNHYAGGSMPIKEREGVSVALVLGYIATKDLGAIDKKMAVLLQLGYSNSEMTKICNTTDKVIRNLKPKVKRGLKS